MDNTNILDGRLEELKVHATEKVRDDEIDF
jgi:hypothetical protein